MKENNIKNISIALATYNGESYISSQLESFVKQTCLPSELVISDDGSQDHTIAIVRRFSRHAPFIVKLIEAKSRLGYTKNFERALSACQGDIILLSDQDDVWFPNKIETIVSQFEKNRDIKCIINNISITDEKLAPSGVTQLDLIERLCGSDFQYVAGCGTAMLRDWREFVLPFPDCGIPYDSWINVLAKRLEVGYVYPVAMQYYRRHGNNTTCSQFAHPRALRLFHPDFWRWLGGKAPHAFDRARSELQAYRDRIASADGRSFVDPGRLRRAIEKLDQELELVAMRRKIVGLPRRQRVHSIMTLLLRGDYHSASGISSALKDLVGPRLKAAD
ncbi:hypothetical+protein [Methylocapsa aurea]|uniref:glycosyltransferase n=1 Tax=Methylocapsa aurea TaxID=663610 RepID=UPI003D18A41E